MTLQNQIDKNLVRYMELIPAPAHLSMHVRQVAIRKTTSALSVRALPRALASMSISARRQALISVQRANLLASKTHYTRTEPLSYS